MFLSAVKPTVSRSVLIPKKAGLKEVTCLELGCPSESDNHSNALRDISNKTVTLSCLSFGISELNSMRNDISSSWQTLELINFF